MCSRPGTLYLTTSQIHARTPRIRKKTKTPTPNKEESRKRKRRVEREKDPRLTKVIAFFFPFKPIVLPAFLAGVPVEAEVFVEGISVEVDLEEEAGVWVEEDEVEVEVAERVERAMVGWSISTYSLSLSMSPPLACLLVFWFGVDADVVVDEILEAELVSEVEADAKVVFNGADPPILIFSMAILFSTSSLNPPSSPFSSPCPCPADFSLFRFFTPSPHASPIPNPAPTPTPKPVPLPSPPAARSCARCISSPGVLFAWVRVD